MANKAGGVQKYKFEDYVKATQLAKDYTNRYAAEIMGVHPRTI